MEIEKNRKGGRVQQIAASLRSDIDVGEFAPGQRLIETELTGRYAVSRGPLREALRLLSVEGLIEITPNRGATVKRMTPKEVRDTMALRIALEGLAAELAAENIDNGTNRSRFEKLAERIVSNQSKSQAEFLKENRLLHDMLIEFADNQQLSLLIGQLRLPNFPRRNMYAGDDEAYRQASDKEHIVIAEAVLSGNGTRARSAMIKHLKHARTRMLRLLKDI